MFTKGQNRQRLQRWCTGASGAEDDAAESEEERTEKVALSGPIILVRPKVSRDGPN